MTGPDVLPDPVIVTEKLGGSSLAQIAERNESSSWFVKRPSNHDEWGERARAVARSATDGWLDMLGEALSASGAAKERLERVAREGGVVVTTGQQPGLFGGPLYTWNKALSALELADAIERTTGVSAAPVFWAATDDADFLEASFTWLRTDHGAVRVEQRQEPSDGEPLSEVRIEGVDEAVRVLRDSARSASDIFPMQAALSNYTDADATMGSAYVGLMRALLEPLGMAVIDASSPQLLAAERPFLVRALECSRDVADALAVRDREIREAGHEPQVVLMPELSLVFAREVRKKARVAIDRAARVAARAHEVLSPNVLLRPVVERVLMPVVSYVAGPGELAYFAQATSVASAVGLPAPLGVPRWSATILEPDVQQILRRRGLEWRSLARVHELEHQIARAGVPADVLRELEAMRKRVSEGAERFKETLGQGANLLDPRVVDGAARGMSFRLDRLERRLLASAKRREAEQLRELAVARGSLFPDGKRQERSLNFIPFLSRYGGSLVAGMRKAARNHAEALLSGQPLVATGEKGTG